MNISSKKMFSCFKQSMLYLRHFSKSKSKHKSYEFAADQIKQRIDSYIDKHFILPPAFHNRPACLYISKVDLYGILKRTPAYLKESVVDFLKQQSIKVDYLSYKHRLKGPIYKLKPPSPQDLEDPYDLILFTDASGLSNVSASYAIGAFILHWDGEGWKTYNRSEIVQAGVISKAEIMAGKMGLDFAVEMGFEEKRVKLYTDCDAFYVRISKFLIDSDFAEFDFHDKLFDLMAKFKKLCPELISRESNLAHYIANTRRLEYLKEQGQVAEEHFQTTSLDNFSDFCKLLHDYQSGNSYFVMRFIGQRRESTPPPYPDLYLQEMEIMRKFK